MTLAPALSVIVTIGVETMVIIVFLGFLERRLLRRVNECEAEADARMKRALAAIQGGFDQLCSALSTPSSITMSREHDGTVVASKDGITYVRTEHGWRFYDAPFTYLKPEDPLLMRLEQAHASLRQNADTHTQAVSKARTTAPRASKEGEYDA